MIDRICIIGGGATGIGAYRTIIDSGVPVREIYILDAKGVGSGVAFNGATTLSRRLLCNTSAGTMSINRCNEAEFLEYLIKIKYPQINPEAFVPRDLVVRYCQEIMNYTTINSKKKNIVTKVFKQNAIRIIRKSTLNYEILTDTGESIVTNYVVLATGCYKPEVPFLFKEVLNSKAPNLFESVYPVDGIESALNKGRRGKVLIVGSKLSAIDAAIVIANCGEYTIDMVSNSGQFPGVRTHTIPKTNVIVSDRYILEIKKANEVKPILLENLIKETIKNSSQKPLHEQLSSEKSPFGILRDEIKLAETGAMEWQNTMLTLIDSLNSVCRGTGINKINSVVSSLKKVCSRQFGATSLENARQILEIMQQGKLNLRPDEVTDLELVQGQWCCKFKSQKIDTYDAIILATGFRFPELSDHGDSITIDEDQKQGLAPKVDDFFRVLNDEMIPDGISLCGLTARYGEPLVNALYPLKNHFNCLVDSLNFVTST